LDDDRALKLLASIDRRLALLSGTEERDLRQALVTDLLRTTARVKMFDGIDGSRGSPEIAKIAGVSDRTVQLFVKELLDMGIVRLATGDASARGVIVERDEDAIVQWFVKRGSGQSSK
jgi:Fic family protein